MCCRRLFNEMEMEPGQMLHLWLRYLSGANQILSKSSRPSGIKVILTRQKGLQNNWLPKFTKQVYHSESQVCFDKDLPTTIPIKIVLPCGCNHPKLFQIADLLPQSFASFYLSQNCCALWVHPSIIILTPKFATTKFY